MINRNVCLCIKVNLKKQTPIFPPQKHELPQFMSIASHWNQHLLSNSLCLSVLYMACEPLYFIIKITSIEHESSYIFLLLALFWKYEIKTSKIMVKMRKPCLRFSSNSKQYWIFTSYVKNEEFHCDSFRRSYFFCDTREFIPA